MPVRGGVTLSAAVLVLLAGCGGGEDSIEVGSPFTYDGFAVAEGWRLTSVERVVDLEEVAQPTVEGEVTNEGEDERFAVFEIRFLRDGEQVSKVTCTSDEKLSPGDSSSILCPGLGSTYPDDYDEIQPGPVER